MTDVFEQYGVFRWKVGSFDIALPVQHMQSVMKNRIVPHKRLYRPGARHDDTGSEPRIWTLTFLAHNDSDEPGIPAAYYPDIVNQLEDSAEVHEVGTLYTTRGPRRCRLEEITRIEDRSAGTDAATITVVWVEDNEDNVTASSFQAPSARSVAKNQLLLVGDGTRRAGFGGGDFFESLRLATSALIALAEGPGNAVAEIEREEQILTDSIDQIETAFGSANADAAAEMTALLTDPMAAAPGRMLRRLADTCARASSEKASGFANAAIVVRRYSSVMSIFDVANDVDQDAYDLLQLNDTIATPNSIPAGIPIRVFA